MEWTIAEARQHFSEVIRGASTEPQIITNRNRPVAAILDNESFQAFKAWRASQRRSLFEEFREFRRLCDDENFEFNAPVRSDRENDFLSSL